MLKFCNSRGPTAPLSGAAADGGVSWASARTGSTISAAVNNRFAKRETAFILFRSQVDCAACTPPRHQRP
jgi:hypothetical protein